MCGFRFSVHTGGGCAQAVGHPASYRVAAGTPGVTGCFSVLSSASAAAALTLALVITSSVAVYLLIGFVLHFAATVVACVDGDSNIPYPGKITHGRACQGRGQKPAPTLRIGPKFDGRSPLDERGFGYRMDLGEI